MFSQVILSRNIISVLASIRTGFSFFFCLFVGPFERFINIQTTIFDKAATNQENDVSKRTTTKQT